MAIRLWETSTGRSPVLKFIEKQPDDHGTRIMKEIDHLAKQGLKLLGNSNKVKQLKGYKGLFELRVDFKGVFYRIIFTVIREDTWLLVAFKKQSNDTRSTYIDTALRRKLSLEAITL